VDVFPASTFLALSHNVTVGITGILDFVHRLRLRIHHDISENGSASGICF
jgi:hypothetical protein